MKIKMLISQSGPNANRVAGEIVDVPEVKARAWIKAKVAEAVSPVKAEKTKPAVKAKLKPATKTKPAKKAGK